MGRVTNLLFKKILILPIIIIIVSCETYGIQGVLKYRKEALSVKRYRESLPPPVKFYYFIKSKRFEEAYSLFLKENRNKIKFWDNYLLPYLKKKDMELIKNATLNEKSEKSSLLSIKKYVLGEKIRDTDDEELVLEKIKFLILSGKKEKAVDIIDREIKKVGVNPFYAGIFLIYKLSITGKLTTSEIDKMKKILKRERELIPIYYNVRGIKEYKKGKINKGISYLLKGIKAFNGTLDRRDIVLLENLIPMLIERGWYDLSFSGINILGGSYKYLEGDEKKNLIYNEVLLFLQLGNFKEAKKLIEKLRGVAKKNLEKIYNAFEEKVEINREKIHENSTENLINSLFILDSKRKKSLCKKILRELKERNLKREFLTYKEIYKIYEIKYDKKPALEKEKDINEIIKNSRNRNVKLIGRYILAKISRGRKKVKNLREVINTLEGEWERSTWNKNQFMYYKIKKGIYDEYVKALFDLSGNKKEYLPELFLAIEMGKRRSLKFMGKFKKRRYPGLKIFLKEIDKRLNKKEGKRKIKFFTRKFREMVFASTFENKCYGDYYFTKNNGVYLLKIIRGKVRLFKGKIKASIKKRIENIISSLEKRDLKKSDIEEILKIQRKLLLNRAISSDGTTYISTDGVLDSYPLNFFIDKNGYPQRRKIVIKVMGLKDRGEKWENLFLFLKDKSLRGDIKGIKKFCKAKKIETKNFLIKNRKYKYIELIGHIKRKSGGEYFLKINDKKIYLKTLEKLKIAGENVMLECCQSELGKYVVGEGIIGFTRYFFSTGTKYLMGSTYKIDDFATDRFQKIFLKKLIKYNFERAYIESMNEFRSRDEFYDPYYFIGIELIESEFNTKISLIKGIRELTYSIFIIILISLAIFLSGGRNGR